jgi:hypothetical protein
MTHLYHPPFHMAHPSRGTPLDAYTANGLAEVKTGLSELSSTYQLRLQTYGALVNEQPLTIYTSRPVNTQFGNWLGRWGVSVQPLLPGQP